jgi:hypothetical protein
LGYESRVHVLGRSTRAKLAATAAGDPHDVSSSPAVLPARTDGSPLVMDQNLQSRMDLRILNSHCCPVRSTRSLLQGPRVPVHRHRDVNRLAFLAFCGFIFILSTVLFAILPRIFQCIFALSSKHSFAPGTYIWILYFSFARINSHPSAVLIDSYLSSTVYVFRDNRNIVCLVYFRPLYSTLTDCLLESMSGPLGASSAELCGCYQSYVLSFLPGLPGG